MLFIMIIQIVVNIFINFYYNHKYHKQVQNIYGMEISCDGRREFQILVAPSRKRFGMEIYMYEFLDTSGCVTHGGAELLYTSIYDEKNFFQGTFHVHDFWEGIFCLEGTCEFHIRRNIFLAHPGDLVILNPGVEHTEYNLGNKWIAIAFKQPQPGFFADSDSGYIYSQNADEINHLALSLFLEVKNKPVGYLTACSYLLDLILLYIRRIGGHTPTTEIYPVSNSRHDTKYYNITWIKQYIESNYPKNITLEMLSEQIRLNKYTLIREFKQVYNVSPMEYLLSCRFREAKFLLSTTNHSIEFIAQGVGFSSGNYFSQRFYKREGITPTAYRRLHQKENTD